MQFPNKLVSKRGLVLQYVHNDAIVFDGVNGYVDDLCDCFETWNEEGALKDHCLKMFQKEIDDCIAVLTAAPKDSVLLQTARAMLKQRQGMFALLQGELGDGLKIVRKLYLANPNPIIVNLLEGARKQAACRKT